MFAALAERNNVIEMKVSISGIRAPVTATFLLLILAFNIFTGDTFTGTKPLGTCATKMNNSGLVIFSPFFHCSRDRITVVFSIFLCVLQAFGMIQSVMFSGYFIEYISILLLILPAVFIQRLTVLSVIRFPFTLNFLFVSFSPLAITLGAFFPIEKTVLPIFFSYLFTILFAISFSDSVRTCLAIRMKAARGLLVLVEMVEGCGKLFRASKTNFCWGSH